MIIIKIRITLRQLFGSDPSAKRNLTTPIIKTAYLSRTMGHQQSYSIKNEKTLRTSFLILQVTKKLTNSLCSITLLSLQPMGAFKAIMVPFLRMGKREQAKRLRYRGLQFLQNALSHLSTVKSILCNLVQNLKMKIEA